MAALTHSTAANAISLVALSGTLIGGLLGIIFKYSERVDAINKQIEADRTAAAAAREADRQLFLTLSKEIVANRQAANDMYLKFLDARDADLTSRQSIQDAIAVLKSRTG